MNHRNFNQIEWAVAAEIPGESDLDAMRELSMTELAAVAGGTDLKAQLSEMASRIKADARAQGQCQVSILLTCINIL